MVFWNKYNVYFGLKKFRKVGKIDVKMIDM